MSVAEVYCVDCTEGLSCLVAGSAAMTFLDLPYGVTANEWDVHVPIEVLWRQLRRVGRPDCVHVFTAVQPFTSLVVCSNLSWFRYEVIWKKNKTSGHLNAKRRPLRAHEDVLVFAEDEGVSHEDLVLFWDREPAYVPQMTAGHRPMNAATRRSYSKNYGVQQSTRAAAGTTLRYPTTVLEVPVVNNDDPAKWHPNQKPEALPAHFIRTYTKPGDLVVEVALGSGPAVRAAERLGRRSVGFDTCAEYVERVRCDLEAIRFGEGLEVAVADGHLERP